jgi:hypothetical protein
MSTKKEIITDIAKYHQERGETVSFAELGRGLNELGVRTNYDTPYSENGGRGIANTLSGVYKSLDREGRGKEAGAVARAFVDKNGNYPWDK